MIKKCFFIISIIGCAFLVSGTILFIVDLYGLLSHSFFERLDFLQFQIIGLLLTLPTRFIKVHEYRKEKKVNASEIKMIIVTILVVILFFVVLQ